MSSQTPLHLNWPHSKLPTNLEHLQKSTDTEMLLLAHQFYRAEYSRKSTTVLWKSLDRVTRGLKTLAISTQSAATLARLKGRLSLLRLCVPWIRSNLSFSIVLLARLSKMHRYVFGCATQQLLDNQMGCRQGFLSVLLNDSVPHTLKPLDFGIAPNWVNNFLIGASAWLTNSTTNENKKRAGCGATIWLLAAHKRKIVPQRGDSRNHLRVCGEVCGYRACNGGSGEGCVVKVQWKT